MKTLQAPSHLLVFFILLVGLIDEVRDLSIIHLPVRAPDIVYITEFRSCLL